MRTAGRMTGCSQPGGSPASRLTSRQRVLLTLALVCAAAGCDETTRPSARDEVELLWSHAAQGAAGRPYADDELAVFTAYTPPSFEEGRVIALDARSGAVRWEHQLPPPPGLLLGGPPSANIVAFEDLVIAPVWGVTALDRRTGAVRWRFQPPPDDLLLRGYAAVGEARLFIPGGETFLYALDPRTGALLWRADLGERPVRPVALGGVVYVATRSQPQFVAGRFITTGHAAAVNAATGDVIWKVPFPETPVPPGGQGGSIGPFAVTDNLVLAAGADARVYALDRQTGAVRWASVGSGPYLGGLALLGQAIIVAGLAGSVDGFDLSTGAVRWQAALSGLGASVTAGDDVALVASGTLTAYDAAGSVRWRHGGASSGGPAYTTPATHDDGVVYAGSTTGFHAIRPPDR